MTINFCHRHISSYRMISIATITIVTAAVLVNITIITFIVIIANNRIKNKYNQKINNDYEYYTDGAVAFRL